MEAALDANVFIHGRGNFGFDHIYTVEEVVEEVESDSGRNVLENIEYSVKDVSIDIVEQVREKSDEINSPTSRADENLVAMALENDYTVVSDDRAVQNLCLHLDVDFQAFLDDSIDHKVRWHKECDVCGGDFSGGSCSRCGSNSLRLKQVRCS